MSLSLRAAGGWPLVPLARMAQRGNSHEITFSKGSNDVGPWHSTGEKVPATVRAQVIGLRKLGRSYRDIAEQISPLGCTARPTDRLKLADICLLDHSVKKREVMCKS